MSLAPASDPQPFSAGRVPSGDGAVPFRRLRVLSIAPTSFFGDYGCHVRILEEARALQALGHDVTILTYFKGDDVPGFRIVRCPPTPWHAAYEVGSSRHKYAFDALLSLRLLRLLAGERFDIVHAHLHEGALIGGILAFPWRTPVCFDYQGSLTDEMIQHGFMRRDGRLSQHFWSRVEDTANRLPAAIFTSTHRAAEELRRRYPARLIRALPDGVNTDTFRPGVLPAEERNRLRRAWNLRPSDPVIGYLGLLASHQGIGCIIDAAAELKQRGLPARWLVMGYPGVDGWCAQANERGLSDEVIFTGRVPYADAPRMLALCDLAVAPKLSLSEGSGKILNYMAMGLPTVAFETPAQAEYLGRLGVYAEPGSARQLAQQAAALIDQPERRAALGGLLRSRVEQHFSWRRMAQSLSSLYGLVLNRRGAGHSRPAADANPQHEL